MTDVRGDLQAESSGWLFETRVTTWRGLGHIVAASLYRLHNLLFRPQWGSPYTGRPTDV